MPSTRCCRRAARLAALLLVAGPGLHGAALPEDVRRAMNDAYAENDPQGMRRAAAVLEGQLRTDAHALQLKQTLGILYLDRLHEPEKALPHLQEAAEAEPQNPDWQLASARALRAVSRTTEAVRYFRKAAELKPKDYWPRYEAANALSSAASYDDAVESYREALELAPKDSEVRLALARTLWAAGDIAGAKRAARLVLEFDQTNEEAHRLLAAQPVAPAAAPPPPPPPAAAPAPPKKAPVSPLDAAIGEAYTGKKPAQFARAAELLEAELARHPGQTHLREVLVDIYQARLHEPAKAIPHLRILAAAKPALWQGTLAKAYAQTGDKAAAAETYAAMAKTLPGDVWCRYELGRLQRELGHPKDAETALTAALSIDPHNKYVRYEMVRCVQAEGETRRALTLARGLVRDDPANPLDLALLGDEYRESHDLPDAEEQYRAALQRDPKDASATDGLARLRRQFRPELKVVVYGFEDTDHFQQLGLFNYLKTFLTGRLSASTYANARWFAMSGLETIQRFEYGATLNYEVRSWLQLSGGANAFKTENLHAQDGGYAGVFLAPAACVDLWANYRSADPVNDSYRAAQSGLSQNVWAGGIDFRPSRYVQLSWQGSDAAYADHNTRRFYLASASWFVPLPWSPVLRVEYQWLDFAHHTSEYSSPSNYTLLRPVLELTPQITSWLALEFHGELPYVFDEQSWGSGITIGPRLRLSDNLNAGASYMHYEIPGGQTTWSGNGFKFDCSLRF